MKDKITQTKPQRTNSTPPSNLKEASALLTKEQLVELGTLMLSVGGLEKSFMEVVSELDNHRDTIKLKERSRRFKDKSFFVATPLPENLQTAISFLRERLLEIITNSKTLSEDPGGIDAMIDRLFHPDITVDDLMLVKKFVNSYWGYDVIA